MIFGSLRELKILSVSPVFVSFHLFPSLSVSSRLCPFLPSSSVSVSLHLSPFLPVTSLPFLRDHLPSSLCYSNCKVPEVLASPRLFSLVITSRDSALISTGNLRFLFKAQRRSYFTKTVSSPNRLSSLLDRSSFLLNI